MAFLHEEEDDYNHTDAKKELTVQRTDTRRNLESIGCGAGQ